MFASMRFLIFLFCFLTFLFSFTCPSFLSLGVDNNDAHTQENSSFFFFAGIKVSLIVHHQCACVCVFTAKAVTVNYLVYVHIVNARAQARAHFLRSQLSVHVWRWSCVCEWEETIKDNWRINVVLMLIALVRRHSSSLKSCLLHWSYLK